MTDTPDAQAFKALCKRIVGWCAHRIEELANGGKIIRPAYKGVAPSRHYQDLEDRPSRR